MQLSLFVESEDLTISAFTSRFADIRNLLDLAEDRDIFAEPSPLAAEPVAAPDAEPEPAAAPVEVPKPKKSHKKKEPAAAAAAPAVDAPPAEEAPVEPAPDPEKEKADAEYLKAATRAAGDLMVRDREKFESHLKAHGVSRYREFAGDITRIRPFIESLPA
jgi:cell division septation protein DedD